MNDGLGGVASQTVYSNKATHGSIKQSNTHRVEPGELATWYKCRVLGKNSRVTGDLVSNTPHQVNKTKQHRVTVLGIHHPRKKGKSPLPGHRPRMDSEKLHHGRTRV